MAIVPLLSSSPSAPAPAQSDEEGSACGGTKAPDEQTVTAALAHSHSLRSSSASSRLLIAAAAVSAATLFDDAPSLPLHLLLEPSELHPAKRTR